MIMNVNFQSNIAPHRISLRPHSEFVNGVAQFTCSQTFLSYSELAQWIHACSWDKRDDDQKAARKKTSGAQKFFPREIPCQSDKTFEVTFVIVLLFFAFTTIASLSKVRQIKPSALFFNCQRIGYKSMGNNSDGQEDDRGVRWHVGGQYYRVCYSCHSSLTELMEFVKYFKPKKLHPSASTPGMNLDQVRGLITYVFRQTTWLVT